MAWDSGLPTPGEIAPAITGILAQDRAEDEADSYSEWTVDELKEAKPLFLYYFRNQNMDPQVHKDEYGFSRRFEMGLQDKTIERLNENWRCKKMPLDIDAELKKNDEKTRVEMWSAVETKMKAITVKKNDQKMLGAGPLGRLLRKYEKVNKTLCKKEIKRIEKLEKMMEEESAAK